MNLQKHQTARLKKKFSQTLKFLGAPKLTRYKFMAHKSFRKELAKHGYKNETADKIIEFYTKN